MAMNGLQNLAEVLESGKNEVYIDPEISQKAKLSITRMLDFAKGLDLSSSPIKNAPGGASGIGPA